MHKKFKKSFENERKIERRSFVTERERKTAKKIERERRSKFPSERKQAIFLSAQKLC